MPLLYYITDRRAFAGDESTRRRRLIDKIAEATRAGVDYIQLREKDLSTRELEDLARQAARVVAEANNSASHSPQVTTALLINSRTDIALAVGAAGVHLRGDDILPEDVRQVWMRSSSGRPVVAISCHSPGDVFNAETNGADFAVFAPVFEKKVFEKKDNTDAQPTGLIHLREACCAKIPVFALGGVTLQNARSCLEAGAKGIAGIRLFQENDVAHIVREVRG